LLWRKRVHAASIAAPPIPDAQPPRISAVLLRQLPKRGITLFEHAKKRLLLAPVDSPKAGIVRPDGRGDVDQGGELDCLGFRRRLRAVS